MTDPEVIASPLSQFVEENGERVEVCIFRVEESKWLLEIVASDGCSTVWDDEFETDAAALAEALSAIKDEGIGSFCEDGASKGAIH